MAAVNNIVLTTEAEALEKILSPFIREQFPSFMQTDYRKLVLFIKAYYEWMEQKGNPGYVLSKLDTIWDSDRSLDEFYSHFKNTYLVSFPELFAVNAAGKTPNKNLLLKKIRDFYGNKGTESAYKFLFRLLYDSDLEFYYPKNDILKASDGVWVEPRSVKTTSSNGTALFGGKSGQLVQYNGSVLVASAFIDTVIQYSFNGLPVTEFFITDINGEFLPNLEVRIQKDSSEWTEVAYSVLGDFFVQLAGSGYRVGDAVTVTASGTGFAAQVEQTGLAGSVKRISISNSGFNYSGDVTVNIFSETGVQSAVVIAKKTAVTNYPGYFSGNRGKLSSNKKIQDGHYYQEFSYELKSEVSIDTYFGVLKSIVHPAGMRMFGSILVQKSLDNTLTSSDQGTFFEIPLIGRYTPYRVGTTLDLRANGVSTTGYWLGVTGDLYPLGYNPYIGSTSEVGPDGKTTSVGTVFVGTSLGYTYCYVPEGGRTAHNPIGAPLGSTSAWYRQKENAWTPQGLNGLVLWLKPENIGVCGSVVNGASMDVWRDASPSGNDAIPPTWDRWNDVASFAKISAAVTGWSNQVYNATDAVTKLTFTFNGLCGGFKPGRLVMLGLSETPASTSITSSYFWYSYGPYHTVSHSRLIAIHELGNTISIEQSANNSQFDNSVFEIEYAEPFMVYTKDGVVIRQIDVGSGKTFYLDSAFYEDGLPNLGHSVTIKEMRYKGKPVYSPSFTSTSGFRVDTYNAGVTIDKLRPTLAINDNGVVGATGISFDGGVIFGPQTIVRGSGLALGSAAIGFTFGPGSSGDKLLVGRHFYLKNGLTFSADMDMFIVYRPTLDSYDYGYGFVSSNRRFTDSHFSNNDDLVVFSRSYNLIDRTTAYQAEGQGYYNFASGVKRYPPEVGILGFRPWKPFTPSVLTADRTQIAYDPHVSGQSMGMVVGEVARDTNRVLYTYVNGDRATNKSPSTGVYVTNATSTGAESPVPTCGVIIDIGRFGSYHRNDLVSSGTIGSAAWIATAITNTPYGFRGVLNEVIVFNRKLQETERQEVYGYLARKYKMDTKLPNSYTRSHPSAYALGLTYWNIEHHPNTKGITGLSAGISFGDIALQNFFTLPDRIYKSKGTILADYTVQTTDTYTDVGL
jgi:hypothetical protein